VTKRYAQIGFSQRIRLEWLEYSANQVLAGNPSEEIKNALQKYLTDKLSVGNTPVRGNRGKAITILMKVWVHPQKELRSFNQHSLHLFAESQQSMHLALHWGMTMAAYPFWRVVAASVGRLLRLQASVSASQVQQRMREQYGERETVFRAARRILRSFHDWGVLVDTKVKGVYKQGNILTIQEPQVTAWMVEALLHATEAGADALDSLLTAPSIFPFRLHRLSADQIANLSGRIESVRHGLDESLLMLVKVPPKE
jgi:hypothetical protein